MRIVVLSRNPNLYSTRRLVEAAEQRGHQAVVIDHTRCYVVMEQNNPSIRINGTVLTDVDAVIPRIGASVTAYGTSIVRQFEMQGVFTANQAQGIVRSRDKLRSMQLLSGEGLGIPKTIFANHGREVEDLIEQIGGTPFIIKLVEGTQGVGVVLAETETTAKSMLETFYSQGISILVQEFIKEARSSDIRAFVVDGKVVGSMKRTGRDGDFRSNLHQGGTAQLCSLTKDEEEAAVAAAHTLSLRVAGVDLLQSARGPLIMEVNSSPGLQGIEAATGKDIAGAIVQFVEENVERQRNEN